jgi:hypothetical protein
MDRGLCIKHDGDDDDDDDDVITTTTTSLSASRQGKV